VGLRAGLDCCGKSRPIGIRSPDRPARRQSLYRLRYPAIFLHYLLPLTFSPPSLQSLVCILYIITHNKAFLFIRHNRSPLSHFEFFHDLPFLQAQYSVCHSFVTRNHHHVLWQPLVSEEIIDLQSCRNSHRTTIF